MVTCAVLTIGVSLFALHEYQKASKEQDKIKSHNLKTRSLDRCLLGLCIGAAAAVILIPTVGLIKVQTNREHGMKQNLVIMKATAPVRSTTTTTAASVHYQTAINQFITDWNHMACIKVRERRGHR